jgi:hypothetical protein
MHTISTQLIGLYYLTIFKVYFDLANFWYKIKCVKLHFNAKFVLFPQFPIIWYITCPFLHTDSFGQFLVPAIGQKGQN